MRRASFLHLTLALCALLSLCLAGCALAANPAKPAPLSRTGVHGIAPQGTAAPLRTDTFGVQNRPLASAGCGKVSPVPAGTTAARQLVSGGRKRSYRVHVPRGYTSLLSVPLVLSFHGHGSNAAAQERMTGFSLLADRYGFLAVYPQGIVGPDGRTGWASGGPGRPAGNDVLFTSDLLTALQGEFCVDPLRIFATGFSNGGGMTALLACELAGRIAAFAPVSGSYYPLPGGCQPGRPVPVLEFHGTRDFTVPYGGRAATDLLPVPEWLRQWAGRDACAADPSERAMAGRVTVYTWTGCAAGAVVEHYRITSWGHHWPALPAADAPAMDGAGAPVASVLIWQFFVAHPLPATLASPSVKAS